MVVKLPEDNIFINLGAEPEQGQAEIKALCQRILPGWNSLNCEGIQITKIGGGISNLLVKVAPTANSKEGTSLSPVAVKVFGDKTELLIDREKELSTLVKLGNAGFGAKVLAVFANGRIEEFLTAITLTPEDMSNPFYVPRIARKLRELHDIEPGQGTPGLVFGTIQGWLDMVLELQFDNPAKAERFAKVDLKAMQREVTEIRQLCEAIQSPVVFSHNDLLSGNILVMQANHDVCVQDRSQCDLSGPLQFIDFEYSEAGYRGFDWGNHFNEYAGFDCDYTRYPGPEQQALFFKHYMAPLQSSQTETAASNVPGADLSEEQLERLSAEANLFALASHVYWGVWALIQARYSPIDFDYLEYSEMRWREFYRRKPEFVAAAKKLWNLA